MDDFLDSITPSHNFLEEEIKQNPDYNNQSFWAAIPKKENFSLKDFQLINYGDDKKVDCFFVHPTGYFLKQWNSDFNYDCASYDRVNFNLVTQASAYGEICNIYAPHYRQATYAAIATNQKDNSHSALNLAYSDIKEAFRCFIKNYNAHKPIVIAAHSQGSLHCQRLLTEDEFKEIFKTKLIAAYLIGYPLEKSYLDHLNLSVSKSPSDTGAVIQFCTVGSGASNVTLGGFRKRLKFWKVGQDNFVLDKIDELASTNPVTWNSDHSWHPVPANSFIMPKFGGKNVFFDYFATSRTNPEFKDIRFIEDQNIEVRLRDDGLLESRGTTVDRILKKDFTGNKDLHIWDYQLFWGQIKQNIKQRVAFLSD